MHDQQQHQDGDSILANARRTYNITGAVVWAVGFGLAPWLSRPGSFGSHFFMTWHAPVGWLVMGFFGSAFLPEYDQQALLTFWTWTTWVFAGQMVIGAIRRANGYRAPSSYAGRGWLPIGDLAARRFAEPVLLFCTGAVLYAVDRPLGSYLVTATICRVLSVEMAEAETRAQIRQYEDAIQMQEYLLWRVEQRKGGES
jgi:hypothetical protein